MHKAATAEVRPSGRNTVINKKTGMSAPSRDPTQVNVKGKARALEKESHSHSEDPSFTVVMPASYATAKCFFVSFEFKTAGSYKFCLILFAMYLQYVVFFLCQWNV